MKEEKFMKKLVSLNFDEGIKQPVYWYLDEDDGNKVVLDEDSIREEFEEKLKQVKDILGV